MNDTGKHSWLSSPTSVIVLLTVLLNAIGVLTVRAFIVRMGLPTNFFENTPIDYLQWGVKAVVLLIMFIIYITVGVAVVAVIISIISFLLRKTILRSEPLKEPLEKLVLRIHTFFQSISIPRSTGILFIVSLTVFIFYFKTQSQIINGFWNSPDCSSGKFEVPLVFGIPKPTPDSNETTPDSNKAISEYSVFSATLIVILSLTLLLSIRVGKKANGEKLFPKIFTCGIFALWLFAIALWAMPYRLMHHNEFEKVNYNDSTAYVISEKDSRLFLYVPGECPFLIEKNDTLLNRSGKKYFENIFNQSNKLKEGK